MPDFQKQIKTLTQRFLDYFDTYTGGEVALDGDPVECRLWVKAKLEGLIQEVKKPYVDVGAVVDPQEMVLAETNQKLVNLIQSILEYKVPPIPVDLPQYSCGRGHHKVVDLPHHDMCSDGLGGCHPHCPHNRDSEKACDRGISEVPHVVAAPCPEHHEMCNDMMGCHPDCPERGEK
jgi:hypothetical protein